MIDDLLPAERPRAETKKQTKIAKGAEGAAAWPPQMGIARADWHPSIDRCALLASGMMCGLVRIDWCAEED